MNEHLQVVIVIIVHREGKRVVPIACGAFQLLSVHLDVAAITHGLLV